MNCSNCGSEIFPAFSDLETGEMIGFCEKCKIIHPKGEYNPVFLELIQKFKVIN